MQNLGENKVYYGNVEVVNFTPCHACEKVCFDVCVLP